MAAYGAEKNHHCFIILQICNDECTAGFVYVVYFLATTSFLGWYCSFFISDYLSDTYHHSSAGICKEGLAIFILR